MNKKLLPAMPLILMPVFIPVYLFLDNLLLVEIFGCGCVPSVQTNMLGIPFNANDLRKVVFTVLAIGLSVWGIVCSKRFQKKTAKLLYCIAVIALNLLLALLVVNTFTWK